MNPSSRRRLAGLALLCLGAVTTIVVQRATSWASPPLKSGLLIKGLPATATADGQTRFILQVIAPPSSLMQGCQVEILQGTRSARMDGIAAGESSCEARLRLGVVPGHIAVRAQLPGFRPAIAELDTHVLTTDSAGDGTPDLLRLDGPDRDSFRRWFTFLAEAQYFQDQHHLRPEINDCAALIRYAYRESLKEHDSDWAHQLKLPLVPSIPAIRKYNYPYTPVGAGLFRIQPGPYTPADPANGTFAQFADAKTLRALNTYRVGDDLDLARPGDLLFYRQMTPHQPFHSMIYLGPSQVERDQKRYVVYHTGPTGDQPGEVRRLSVEELLHFPAAEWRPVLGNPNFLGIYRWNILRSAY